MTAGRPGAGGLHPLDVAAGAALAAGVSVRKLSSRVGASKSQVQDVIHNILQRWKEPTSKGGPDR